jgi:RNA polymerase sigma factor (sigma-70 family)
VVRFGEGGPQNQQALTELIEAPGAALDAIPCPDHGQALAEVSRNHHAALVRFLTVRTGSVEDAKEIVQEAYAKMLALEQPGTISLLAGYLWRIAVNLAIDRKRHRAVHERFRSSAEPVLEQQALSAESIVEARERLAIVERAIEELPPRCLEAFVLHVLQGKTFDAVGREMVISGRMAKKHVARALEYLQTCLDAANDTGRQP